MGNKINKNNSQSFVGKVDRYNGVQVDSMEEPCASKEEFATKLAESLNKWKTENKRGIWFKIHLDCAHWIPILIGNGFRYHHAQETHVVMITWLPETEACTLPKYPHNYIGVGAFVVNEDKQILVVKERYATKDNWKLPGGYVEMGENLAEAAQREVTEETGITTEFVSVIAFRHVHKITFQCSDMYFVCRLRPLTSDIQKCNRELAECRWMPLEDYYNESDVSEVNRHFARSYLEHERHGFSLTPAVIESNNYNQIVYTLIKEAPEKL